MGSRMGRVRALSRASFVRAGAGAVGFVRCGAWRRRGVVLDAQGGELSGGGPPQLHDMWVCLLEAVEGAEEAPLDAGHVLLCEVGVVLGGGASAWPQQGHEAACHHVRAELLCDGARGAGSSAVRGGLLLLGTEGDLSRPPLCGDLPGPLGPFGKAVHRPAKTLVAAADGEQRVQGLAPPRAPDVSIVWLVPPGVRVGAWAVRGGGGVKSAGRRELVPWITRMSVGAW